MKEEVLEFWRQLLGGVQRNLWHALSTTNLFNCNLQLATSLSMFEYDTILRASGIMVKQGNTYAFKKKRLDELKEAPKENMTVHIICSQVQRQGAHLYFITVQQTTYRNPLVQAKANPRVLPNRHGNGLDEERLHLLKHLCAERVSDEEPELIVENGDDQDDGIRAGSPSHA